MQLPGRSARERASAKDSSAPSDIASMLLEDDDQDVGSGEEDDAPERCHPTVDARQSHKSIPGELASKVNSHYLSRSQWLQLPNPTAGRRI